MDIWTTASTGRKIVIAMVIVAAVIGVLYVLGAVFGGAAGPDLPGPTGVPSTPGKPEETPVPTPGASAPPVAVISGPTQAYVGEGITLSGANSLAAEGHDIVQYHWDLSDGTQSAKMEVTHAYRSTGHYQVTLTVTDDNGRRNSSSVIVRVTDAPTTTVEPEETATPEPEATVPPEIEPSAEPTEAEPSETPPEVEPTSEEPEPTPEEPEPTSEQPEPTSEQPEPTTPPEPTEAPAEP
jgi:PKD repeat protein